MSRKRANLLMILLCLAAFWEPSRAAERSAASSQNAAAGMQLFERKIRPVLIERCYECHSTDAKKIKGGLRLDTRDAWMQGGDGGPIIVPGDPDKSRLVQALRYASEDLQMPPKEKLSAEQIADFEAWVRMGAPDPRTSEISNLKSQISNSQTAAKHWAFQPVTDHPVPRVKDRRWPKSPIDNFILADLEEKKLKPAAAADKRTLIRRAAFDLTGLPPRPEEIEAFLADPSPEAFAKVVERLLDSPHFGERWGRHWLDVARYADSNGLEINQPFPNAWRYRDYVMESFNSGKPFDQFIREQLAGDLLPARNDEERFERLTATGFLVLGPKALFEPNQEKLVMDVVDEQIDVSTKAFLGLTASCARCHDHKFDPIPTRDYYALAGIFKSTATLASAAGPQSRPDAPRWLERPLVTAEKAKEIEASTRELARLSEELRVLREFPGGVQSSKLPGIVVDNAAAQLTGRWKQQKLPVGTFVDQDYWHDANSDKGKMTARFAPKLPHTGSYEVLIAYVPRYDRATNVPVAIHSLDGPHEVTVNQKLPPQYRNAFVSVGAYRFQAGTNGAVVISNAGTKGFVTVDAAIFVPIDEWKLELAMAEEASKKALSQSQSEGSAMPTPQMSQASATAMAEAPVDRLSYAILDLRAKIQTDAATAMAVQEGSIQNSRINIRGDYEKLGDEVPRGFLKVLVRTNSKLASPIDPKSSGRLELANWIASPENPLTARVAVNRIWLHLFGRGLVETPDNFGLMGEKPTHPELLDYLARRFVAEGWSMKKMVRAIMLTSVYQMSSEHSPKAYAKDPDNRYLWRMNRRRLEAEALRDAILSVSSALDLTRGGSILPTNNAPRNNPMLAPEPVASNRRSVYLPVLRNNVNDVFQVFDFSDPHAVAGKRHITTTAPQALFMMNSEVMLEQSRRWAEALLARSASDDRQRVSGAYVQAFGRPAKIEEVNRALKFIEKFQAGLSSSGSTSNRLEAWQAFCQVLLASTEFRYLN
ncbi:MAG: DUF1553 domain-containing protein [Verrucomicrobia bacterium]|nr:DUF1553 domain-containing protein [Verrucomicrobiota bacterium]